MLTLKNVLALSLSILASWPNTGYTYLHLDNCREASPSEVQQDPFILLRTKHTTVEKPFEWEASWAAWSKRQPINMPSDSVPSIESVKCPLSIDNSPSLFVGSDPYFSIEVSSDSITEIHWQISKDSLFKEVNSNLERLITFSDWITLSPIDNTFISSNEEYFLRVRGKVNGRWSQWARPHRFIVEKPERVLQIRQEKNNDNSLTLFWDYNVEGVTYHLFGSDALDFIPSLYSDSLPKKIMGDKITEVINEHNHLLSTQDRSVTLEKIYPYYRIIVEKNGLYSIPSDLFYAKCLSKRTWIDKAVDGIASRKSFSAPAPNIKPRSLADPVWEEVQPYLMPDDHPMKAKLDEIFSSSRVILSIKSMEKAGFINPKPRKWTHLIVTRHPDLPGLIIKAYLDVQRFHKNKPEYYYWMMRIDGVEMIRKEIEAKGWESKFKTPKKWMYVLPDNPSPPKEFQRKYFILVEEDMNIYGKEANNKMWQEHKVTPTFLFELYTILDNLGLRDCAKPDNVPFSLDGRVAFVDTQTFNAWPVNYNKLTPYLSYPMRAYWKSITK